MPANLPKPVWNLFAVFFAAWGAASAWLLVGGESSPVVRLAFALCGAATLFAGSVGGLFRAVGRGTVRVLSWLTGEKLGCWMGVLVVIALFASVLVPVFQQAHSKSEVASQCSELKQEGLALHLYANEHNEILPPDMRENYLNVSLASNVTQGYFTNALRRGGNVWCKEFAGLRLSDIAHPEKIVAAYSRKSFGGHGHAVLYLDGHVQCAHNKVKLARQLRQRPSLLAHAVRARAKRYADAKPTAKKAVP
ncbi:MAG: hypothetical protein H7Y38_17330 [Armatimonadetes bacterium]|nr:hypothetical protein [Armatimonadota bacterium]